MRIVLLQNWRGFGEEMYVNKCCICGDEFEHKNKRFPACEKCKKKEEKMTINIKTLWDIEYEITCDYYKNEMGMFTCVDVTGVIERTEFSEETATRQKCDKKTIIIPVESIKYIEITEHDK